jgi:hypothetical protein
VLLTASIVTPRQRNGRRSKTFGRAAIVCRARQVTSAASACSARHILTLGFLRRIVQQRRWLAFEERVGVSAGMGSKLGVWRALGFADCVSSRRSRWIRTAQCRRKPSTTSFARSVLSPFSTILIVAFFTPFVCVFQTSDENGDGSIRYFFVSLPSFPLTSWRLIDGALLP